MLSLLRVPVGTVMALLAAASPATAAAINGHQQPAPASAAGAFPAQAASSLDSVSCRSTTWCMAVGDSATSRPYSALWNGKSWLVLSTPAPARATNLASVSCASRTNCIAVGSAQRQFSFADAWNGRRWRLLALGKQTLPLGVSCPKATFCMAVGRTDILLSRSSGGSHAVAMTWNGSAWHALAMPAIPGSVNSGLASVSCASTRLCTAVGFYTVPGMTRDRTMAEQWDGSAWHVQSIPDIPPVGGTRNGDVLSSVSCTPDGQCMAVGTITGFSNPDQALAESWDGHSWTVVPGADPGGSGTDLYGVKCLESTCMAVGTFGTGGTVAEQWDGHSWHLTGTTTTFETGLPAAVSCVSLTSCMAVGSGAANTPTLAFEGLSEQWNGRGWQVHWVSHSAGLAAVSCDPAIGCMAVGSYLNARNQLQNLTELWNGSGWRQHRAPAPVPVGVEASGATGVSCSGPAFCMAIGPQFSMTWNGLSWRQRPVPATFLGTNVSCTSQDNCVVVGLGGQGNVVWRWTGRSWQMSALGLGGGALTDVSCRSTTWCMAIGADSGDRPLAARWNGRAWQVMPSLPVPAGGFFDEPTGISCTSRSRCLAVGHYQVADQPSRNTAELWNGKTWRLLTPPGQAGLRDVSCSSADSCLAVGQYTDINSGVTFNVAMRWNGRAWKLVPPAGPGGLVAVSCLGAANCVAVGQATSVTLADRWDGTRWQRLRAVSP